MSWQQVITENPGFSFLIIILGGGAVLRFFLLCWNRFLRCMNIRKHGWPPAHCDADGDFRPRSDDEDIERLLKKAASPDDR